MTPEEVYEKTWDDVRDFETGGMTADQLLVEVDDVANLPWGQTVSPESMAAIYASLRRVEAYIASVKKQEDPRAADFASKWREGLVEIAWLLGKLPTAKTPLEYWGVFALKKDLRWAATTIRTFERWGY